MKKKLFSRTIAAALSAVIIPICLFAVPAYALKSENVVLVGACTDFGVSNVGGEYYGFAYDYFNELQKRTGHRYSYVEASPSDLVQMLSDGKIDVIACAGESDMRYGAGDNVTRGNISLAVKYSAVYVPSTSEIDFYDTKALSAMKIGYLAENYEKYFEDGVFLCGEIADASFVRYNSEDQLKDAFNSGKVDAVVKDCFRPWNNEKIVYQFNTEDCFFYTSDKDKSLAMQLDEAVAGIFVSNSKFTVNLCENYFSRAGMIQYAYSAEEKQFIKDNSEITVAYNLQSSTIEKYDSASGKLTGSTGVMLGKLEELSGIKIKIVPCNTLTECVDMLKSGSAVAACGGVNVYSMASYGSYRISVPYMRTPIAIAGLPGTMLADHMKVAVPAASEEIRSLLKRAYSDINFLPYESVESCFKAVESGEADVICAGAYEIVNLVNSLETDISLLKVDTSSQSECLTYSEKCPVEFITLFGKCLANITGNDMSVSSYAAAAAADANTRAGSGTTDYLFIIIIAFAVMLLLLGISILLNTIHSKKRIYTDPITGGRTKSKFIADAARILKKDGDKWAVVMFDINKFKFLNDRLGYEEGNRVLERIYKTLSDKLEKDEVFARISDDNFAFIIHDASDNEVTTRISGIIAEFERRNSVFVNYPLIFSAGICRTGQCVEKGVVNINAALDRCQIAKKTLKGMHHTSIAFYDGKIRETALREKDFENVMPKALARREFECFLQPKYGLITRRIEGAEALIRWNSKDFGFISPGDFIPLSEKNGFVVELDFFILEEVCKAMRRWIDSGKTPVVISVNQSRLHLNDDDFIWRLREIVDKYDIPYKYIELELTESVFTENVEKLLQVMQKLHDIGFKLSLDDFGSGYSSLNMLKDIPVDVVKIDREFFNGTVNSSKGRAVISTVVDLASKLNMNVISEGVETKEQVDYLTDIHCDMVQGYYFARPMTIPAFEELWFTELEEASQAESDNVG